MLSLQSLLFTLCFALRCVTSAVRVIHVTGFLGTEVKVSCTYGQGYESYEKYLCKNSCTYTDVLITTSQPRGKKYSIYDDKRARTFTVTISELRSTDAGTYWCGLTRAFKDMYTEVKLKLMQDSCCNTVTKIKSYEGYSEVISCPYKSQYQNNLKYICRGNRPSTCLQQALITSDTKENGRIRFNDDPALRVFTVNITSLTQKDSGSYLCGVQRNFDLDVFAAVELEVQEWCCVKSKKTSGTPGYSLTLQCPYPPQHQDNRKFLCKGDHYNNCTDIVMSQSRFTLQDDAPSSTFSVMITELEAADAGTYWCGSDTLWRTGNYTKIELSVGGVHYAVYTVVPVALLMCVLLFLYKYKCYKVKEAEAVVNRNTLNAEHVIDAAESGIYGNQDFLMTWNPFDVPGRDEPEYQNITTTEEIYCNERYHEANRRYE